MNQEEESDFVENQGVISKGLSGIPQSPILINDGSSQRPPAVIVDECGVSVDAGGCTAAALTNLGIFEFSLSHPMWYKAAAEALDQQILPMWNKFLKERGPPDLEISELGIPGEQWHIEVIKRAVQDAGWHFNKVISRHFMKDWAKLSKKLQSGRYLIIGVLSNVLKIAGKRERKKYDEYTMDAPHKDPTNWLHSIAVVDGTVYDGEEKYPISCLHLNQFNVPDKQHAYMLRIDKVYQLFKCAADPLRGASCKGGCKVIGLNENF